MALGIFRLGVSFGLLAVLAVADPRNLTQLSGGVRLPASFPATATAAGDRVLTTYKWRLLLLARWCVEQGWVPDIRVDSHDEL